MNRITQAICKKTLAIPAVALGFSMFLGSPLAYGQAGTGHAAGYCGHSTPCTDPSPVPEPSTMTLALAGIAVLAVVALAMASKRYFARKSA